MLAKRGHPVKTCYGITYNGFGSVRVLIVGALLLLWGCGPSPEERQKQREQQEIDAGISLVRARLRDPESAQFTQVRLSHGVVCGYVNSKNGFGGYAGPSRFFVSNYGSTVQIEQEKSATFDILYEHACVLDPVQDAKRVLGGK